MEGTGVYHEQATLILVETGVTVSIVNPGQVKIFGRGLAVRTKIDGVDSFVFACYGALIKPAVWQPSTQEAHVLRALLARRDAVVLDLQRELNRLEKADATEIPIFIRQSIDDSIEFLRTQLAKLQQEIDDHIDRHPGLRRDMEFLTSIPAVGQQTGSNLLAIVHSYHFDSAEQLAAYLGLVPVKRQQDLPFGEEPDCQKPDRLEFGPCCIWWLLSRPNIILTSRRFMIDLAKGKAKMAAIGAAMRKFVHLCFGVLSPYVLPGGLCKNQLTSKTVSKNLNILFI